MSNSADITPRPGKREKVHRQGVSRFYGASHLIQPDTVLPSQYYDACRRKIYLEPEKKLMLAVLEDTIYCFQKYLFANDKKGKTLFREAEEWILQTGSQWFFSFENVCDSLGFNPNYMRQGLIYWREKKQKRRQSRRRGRAPSPSHGCLYN